MEIKELKIVIAELEDDDFNDIADFIDALCWERFHLQVERDFKKEE